MPRWTRDITSEVREEALGHEMSTLPTHCMDSWVGDVEAILAAEGLNTTERHDIK